MSRILAIDLGSTSSRMAIMERGKPHVLENSEGARTTPSVVAFTKSGERLVGDVAKRQAVTNAVNTVFSIKRFMGRTFDEVRDEIHRVPFKVVKGKNGDACVQVTVGGGVKTFSPPEISAMILAKLKADAEAKLGEKIWQAVLTVPSHFDRRQVAATKDAGRIAGLEVLRITSDPLAASIAYGLDKKEDEKIAVFDLGGGSVSISILEIGNGVFFVRSTDGDNHLGGDDWDHRIIDWILAEFRADTGIDLSDQVDAVQRIREEAERAKIALSSSQQYDIQIPFITSGKLGPQHIQRMLTRARLEHLTGDLFERTITPVRSCMEHAELNECDIDEVVLVGGMTRMPKMIETARRFIGKESNKEVNPDEAVTIGAAIVAGLLRGEVKDVLPCEATAHTLSLETADGVATPMIPRNTTIPTRKTQIFTTNFDNQVRAQGRVIEGEHPLSRDNGDIGTLLVAGIPPAPPGVPQIEVTFDIDANGILHVSAKDLATGKDGAFSTIESAGLSQEERANPPLHPFADLQAVRHPSPKNAGAPQPKHWKDFLIKALALVTRNPRNTVILATSAVILFLLCYVPCVAVTYHPNNGRILTRDFETWAWLWNTGVHYPLHRYSSPFRENGFEVLHERQHVLIAIVAVLGFIGNTLTAPSRDRAGRAK